MKKNWGDPWRVGLGVGFQKGRDGQPPTSLPNLCDNSVSPKLSVDLRRRMRRRYIKMYHSEYLKLPIPEYQLKTIIILTDSQNAQDCFTSVPNLPICQKIPGSCNGLSGRLIFKIPGGGRSYRDPPKRARGSWRTPPISHPTRI